MIDTPLSSPLDTGHLVALVVLALVLVTVVYTELRDNRIANRVTLAGMGSGLLIGYLPGGLTLISSLLGLLIGFGFLFLFYMYGGMGGGDVKLMGAIGALLGHHLVLPTIVYTSAMGVIMAVMMMIWRPQPEPASSAEDGADEKPAPRPRTVPYGLAIVAGTVLTLCFCGV